MATSSVEDPCGIDHLSNLPNDLLVTILSFLPTRIAARSSVLSRRFRHLWEASPSLYFTVNDIPEPQSDNFIGMADRALLRRNPSYPLHSLYLDLSTRGSFEPIEHAFFISSMFVKSSSLHVRHLTISRCGCLYLNILPILLPIIFATDSLLSLSIDYLFDGVEKIRDCNVNYDNTFNCLKFLYLGLGFINPVKFEQFISGLSSLEELHLRVNWNGPRISSKTIRKLNLFISSGYCDAVMMFLPSTVFIELLYYGDSGGHLPHFHGEIPLLRKAVIKLNNLHGRDACAVTGLLNCMKHVEELSLHMGEDKNEKYPFPFLLESGRNTPNFLNLKHLDVAVYFNHYNFEAVVTMLQHSPALESVSLVHKVTWDVKGRESKDWEIMFPDDDDDDDDDGGDNCHAYFRNLHLGENRNTLMKSISKRCTPKQMTSLGFVLCVKDIEEQDTRQNNIRQTL